jgi:5'-nucleotidase
MTYAWNANAAYGDRVRDLRVGGVPVDPAREVRITVNSFLAEGGDGVSLLRQGRQRIGGVLDLDALVAHLLATNPSPDPSPRIRWVQ